jgi:hypothetical protein
MTAYLGNPTHSAFYSLCAIAQNLFLGITSLLWVLALAIAFMQQAILLVVILCTPSCSQKQKECQSWHSQIGPLSNSQIQELVKQGQLPK